MPYAPVYDTSEVPEDPQAKHLQLFVDAVHPAHPEGSRWRTVRSPVSFDGECPLEVTAPLLLGNHNEVLRSGASPSRPFWSPQPMRQTST